MDNRLFSSITAWLQLYCLIRLKKQQQKKPKKQIEHVIKIAEKGRHTGIALRWPSVLRLKLFCGL